MEFKVLLIYHTIDYIKHMYYKVYTILYSSCSQPVVRKSNLGGTSHCVKKNVLIIYTYQNKRYFVVWRKT